MISVSAQGATVIKQNYTSAISGQSVQIDCEVQFGHLNVMAWYFGKEQLYYYHEGSEDHPAGQTKYSVKKLGQHFILNIKDLSLEDEGIYLCSSLASDATAHLLILGKYKFNLYFKVKS